MHDLYTHLTYIMALASDTPYEILTSTSRLSSVVTARQIVWHYLKHSREWTSVDIARKAKKDHTTVLYGVGRIKTDLSLDWEPTVRLYSRFLRLLAEEAQAKAYNATH